MAKKLESKEFFVRDYLNGQDMTSDISAYTEKCKEKYQNRCKIRTATARDEFGVGIEVIVEEIQKEKEEGEER